MIIDDLLKEAVQSRVLEGKSSESRMRDLETILSVVRKINTSLVISDVLELVLDEAIRITNSERGFLMLADKDRALKFVAGRNGACKSIHAESFQVSSSVLEDVFATGESLCIENALNDERFDRRQSIMNLELQTIICSPLRTPQETIGVIYVDSKYIRAFDKTDILNILEILAGQAAVAIKNANLYENLSKQKSQLEEMLGAQRWTEEVVRRSEERYRSLYEVNPHPMWVYDVETLAFLDVNDVACSQYGFSREEFLKMTLRDIRPEKDTTELTENIRDSHDIVQSSGVWSHRRKDGSLLWVEISSHALRYNGRKARLVLGNNVTGRRNTEDDLRLAEEKYRGIFENAVIGIFQTSIEGRYLIANPTLARMYGFETPDELMAVYNDLSRHFYVKPGRRGEFLTLMIQHDAVSAFESQVYRKDGSIIWISERARIMRDPSGAMIGFEGTTIDITERKRAEESTSKLLTAVEQTDDVVFMTEIDGTITYVNPAFETLYGFSKEEAIGKTPRILNSGKHDREHYQRFWQELFSGRSYQGDQINKTKAGDEVFVEVAVNPVYNTENLLTGFISVQRDVTRRKREETEHKSLEMQFAQSQKIESIGTLAGGIAHDFNNILGIIIGHVALLRRGGSDPKRLASSLDSITTAVNRGAGLTKQILTFARKTDVLFEPIRLNEIVEELKMLQETFPKKIMFTTNLGGLDLVVEGDRTQLHQTLLNLCVNARDAMPDGGSISISIEEETSDDVRRTFPEARIGQYARVSVSDTGSGMDQETVLRIFEPFFTTKEIGKGTGLGLAVVYGIVKSHKGFINVKSERGRGTTFLLHLPVIWQDEEVKEKSSTQVQHIEGGNETILVVEDEEMLRSLLESVLTSRGYNVLTADDGKEAVEMYRKHHHEIAIVVTDVGLPELSGQDAFLKMKELNPHVKVIFASGYLEPQAKADLFAAGAKSVINKPYAPNDILNQIRVVLQNP